MPLRNGSPNITLRLVKMCTIEYPAIAALPLCQRVCPPLSPDTGGRANKVSDYKDDGTNVLLDANENAYGPGLALNSEGALQTDGAGGSTGASKPEIDFLGLNRYPDPYVQTLHGRQDHRNLIFSQVTKSN